MTIAILMEHTLMGAGNAVSGGPTYLTQHFYNTRIVVIVIFIVFINFIKLYTGL